MAEKKLEAIQIEAARKGCILEVTTVRIGPLTTGVRASLELPNSSASVPNPPKP
jgi:hypothetical protein